VSPFGATQADRSNTVVCLHDGIGVDGERRLEHFPDSAVIFNEQQPFPSNLILFHILRSP
jgi:hypothetical protein